MKKTILSLLLFCSIDLFGQTMKLNNNTVTIDASGLTTGANNYQAIAINKYLKGLVAGDDISIWVTNTQTSGDPIISGISIYFRKEHN